MASKSFQVALEAATNENNTEENWDRILGKRKINNKSFIYLFLQRFVILLKMVKLKQMNYLIKY
jgi:hypothetical protein